MTGMSELSKCKNCPSFKKSIFCTLGEEEQTELNNLKITNTYKKGQTLYVHGTPGYGAYCIGNGKLKVSRMGLEGKETIVQIAAGGDLIGYQNVFGDSYSSTTVTPIEDSTICLFTKEHMARVISKMPKVATELIKKISEEVTLSEDKITSLSQYNVRERLANFLIYIKNNFGVKMGNRWKLNITLSREEMASMIGIAPETLVRFLSELKSVGLVEQEGKVLYIADEMALRSFSGLTYRPQYDNNGEYRVAV